MLVFDFKEEGNPTESPLIAEKKKHPLTLQKAVALDPEVKLHPLDCCITVFNGGGEG